MPFRLNVPCQTLLNDTLTKPNFDKYIMRFIFTISITLALVTGWTQTSDSIDTIVSGNVHSLYVKGRLIEKIFYKGDEVDIRVIYLYKDGLLVRREWWQKGKRISYTIE
jgi:hypothetical protein